MKKILLLCVVLLALAAGAEAQCEVPELVLFRGVVIDSTNGEAIPYAAVNVREPSSFFWAETTDMEGQFEMNVLCGEWYIEVTYVGFEHYWRKINIPHNAELYTVKLKPQRLVFPGVEIIGDTNIYEGGPNNPLQKMEVEGVKVIVR